MKIRLVYELAVDESTDETIKDLVNELLCEKEALLSSAADMLVEDFEIPLESSGHTLAITVEE